ncbi:MAG TPA: hypothetical protein VHG93_20020 [Longimicrobium sp.]|nr:hypothetical protein [Longimicrobium sp.]
MLVLYSDQPQNLPRLKSALPGDEAVVLAQEWKEIECTAPRSLCSVVMIEWLRGSDAFPRLSAFKHRNPAHPVVLVTRWDPDNARQLKDVRVEEVVWNREIEQELATAVHRVCTHHANVVRCLAVPFEQAEHLPAALRTALAYACRSDVPVRSVKQLAAAVGSNRRTLWYQWCKALGGASDLRLQDFLHWTLLLRAVGRKTPDRTWTAVAEDVGVHAHTLGRFARQLAGRTLSELASEGVPQVVQRFRGRVMELLLRSGEAFGHSVGA